MSLDDTIFALSSAAGRAGVAVVRVSGPAAGIRLKSGQKWADKMGPMDLQLAPARKLPRIVLALLAIDLSIGLAYLVSQSIDSPFVLTSFFDLDSEVFTAS